MVKGGLFVDAAEFTVPTPPVCLPTGPEISGSFSTAVNNGMILGLVSFNFTEPTGMDLFLDSIKSLLPPGTKPTRDQTSHPEGVRDRSLRPRPHQLPPHLKNITLFPNPFVDKINLEIDVPEATKLRLVLLDASGQRVYSDRWNTQPGYNTMVLSPPQQRLKGSLFYLHVTDDQGFTVTRQIIRR